MRRVPRSTLLALVVLALLPGGAGADAPVHVVRVAAVGDVHFGRYVDFQGRPVYAPVTPSDDPFAEVRPMLRQADLVFGNLETPIMREPRALRQYGITFRAEPDRAQVLAAAGFHVLSLANNHITNLGPEGADETRRYLLQAGVLPLGAGTEDAQEPLVLERYGVRLCLLAYSLWNGDHPDGQKGLSYVRPADFMQVVPAAVRAARKRTGADFVLVSLHWGEEYEAHPGEEQRRQAYALVEAGADVVLGHHPHVLQDFERYQGAVIAYSLGNFLFDNPVLDRRQTVILQMALTVREVAPQATGGQVSSLAPERDIEDVSLVPVLSGRKDCLPRPARGPDWQALAARLRALAPGMQIVPEQPGMPQRLVVLEASRH